MPNCPACVQLKTTNEYKKVATKLNKIVEDVSCSAHLISTLCLILLSGWLAARWRFNGMNAAMCRAECGCCQSEPDFLLGQVEQPDRAARLRAPCKPGRARLLTSTALLTTISLVACPSCIAALLVQILKDLSKPWTIPDAQKWDTTTFRSW